MLIEFSVSNFRSFREKQTFSMVAAPRLRKKENVISPVVKGEKLPDLLKMAAVYGPNASGKSNLMKAIGIIHLISMSQFFDEPPITAFRFDPALINQPSHFEWHFIAENQRYFFEIAILNEQIIEERLLAFPMGKETLLYHRNNVEQYQFGVDLEGGELLHQAWRDLTNSSTLFIQQAVQNSRDKLTQLSIPFKWLLATGCMHLIDTKERIKSTLQQCQSNPKIAKALASFLQAIDAPVVEIQVKAATQKIVGNTVTSDYLSELLNPHMPPATKFIHSTALGTASFNLDDESDGTKNLIGFWESWAIFNSGKNSKDGLLVVDELDSSLHPNIVAILIQQRQTQDHPRQLIFTTHDTHLMDTKLLRRDQIWLTERDANGATQLYSIHDIAGRESEDIEKRYYEGRYRGLPILLGK